MTITYTKSPSDRGTEYDVLSTELGWICLCPDHMYKGITCKHIHAVEISLVIRKKVQNGVVIQPLNISLCPQCQSDQIVKHGKRHNKYGDIQRFHDAYKKEFFTVKNPRTKHV